MLLVSFPANARIDLMKMFGRVTKPREVSWHIQQKDSLVKDGGWSDLHHSHFMSTDAERASTLKLFRETFAFYNGDRFKFRLVRRESVGTEEIADL